MEPKGHQFGVELEVLRRLRGRDPEPLEEVSTFDTTMLEDAEFDEGKALFDAMLEFDLVCPQSFCSSQFL
jgi:hypothetical protein